MSSLAVSLNCQFDRKALAEELLRSDWLCENVYGGLS